MAADSQHRQAGAFPWRAVRGSGTLASKRSFENLSLSERQEPQV
jgi:hypothetical protein